MLNAFHLRCARKPHRSRARPNFRDPSIGVASLQRAIAFADHVFLMRGGRIALSRPSAGLSLEELHDAYEIAELEKAHGRANFID